MATKHVICNLNLNGNQIENVVAEVLATAPSNPVTGQFYFDSSKAALGYYDGANWIYAGAGNIYEIDTLDDNPSGDVYKLYYGSSSGTQGIDTKTTFKFRAIKSLSDYITLGTGTTSSKEYITIDLADLAISKVTGLQSALDSKLDDSQLSTSSTLIDSGQSSASDTKIPSQKAVKSYVDNEVNKIEMLIAGGMHFIGTWDGTKTISQNLTTSGLTKLRKGDFWVVSVEGSSSGIPSGQGEDKLRKGDMVVSKSDVSSISSVTASDFDVIDNTESVDLVRLNATQTLTNKTLDGGSNTFTNIPESAVTNLTTDLDSKVAKTSITTSDGLNTNTSTNKTTIPSDYTVGKVIDGINSNSVHQYKQEVTTGTSVTITADTHLCGKYPEVKVYQSSSTIYLETLTSVSINALGDVTVSWNGAASVDKAILIIILGSTSLT